MKRSEKTLFVVLALCIALASAFAAFWGIAVQRRNAARAQLPRPESFAMYESLASSTSGGAVEPATSLGKDRELLRHIETFDVLFRKSIFTENDPEFGGLLDWVRRPRAEWPTGIDERLRSLVTMIQPLLADTRALAAQGGPVHALDFTQGYAMPLPHLKPMRNLANLLYADALAAAEQGNFDRVTDDIMTMMQLGDALAEEPVLMSQLVRVALYETALGAVSLLPRDRLDEANYSRLMQHMAQGGRRDQFADCLAGEAMIIEREFDDPSRVVQIGFPEESSVRGMLHYAYKRAYVSPIGKPLACGDEAAAMAIFGRMEEAARLPYYESEDEQAAIDATIQHLSWKYLVSRELLGGLDGANRAQARHEAMLGVTQLGLAVERFCRDRGNYPDSLNAVASEFPDGLPLDPFSGKPYVFRVTGGEILLSSIGMNFTDDSGRHHPRDADIVWRGVEE